MKKFAVVITLLCIFGFNQGCAAVSSTTINKEARLKERIEQAYKCFKERKHEDLLEYFIAAKSYDNAERQKALRLFSLTPIFIDYFMEVQEIKIDGDIAKVKIKEVAFFKDKREEDIHFDHWIYKDKEWYISTFAKDW
jgi:hypothetical protein